MKMKPTLSHTYLYSLELIESWKIKSELLFSYISHYGFMQMQTSILFMAWSNSLRRNCPVFIPFNTVAYLFSQSSHWLSYPCEVIHSPAPRTSPTLMLPFFYQGKMNSGFCHVSILLRFVSFSLLACVVSWAVIPFTVLSLHKILQGEAQNSFSFS